MTARTVRDHARHPQARRRFCVLLSPMAGGGRARAVLQAARAELETQGAEYRVVTTASLAASCAEAARGAERGETVLAVGGDGLAGPLAGVLRDREVALALVPAGRGNDFARVLGVPSVPHEAVQLALRGAERLVDVGFVNDRPFLGIASLGIDSDVQDIANASRVVRGQLVYVYGALRALAGWRHASFEVDIDGRRHEVTGFSVAVANSGVFGGGMRLLPHARIDDGRLDVMFTAQGPKLRYLANLPRVFSGRHLEDRLVSVSAGERIDVRADRPFTVYADGDPIAELPVTVTVRPRCLRVVAPPP
jgi:YegS/Rv2252/BmrU family lipid kinase